MHAGVQGLTSVPCTQAGYLRLLRCRPTLTQALESGAVERNIGTLRGVLARRLSVLARALHKHCPSCTFVTPKGGYFLWVKLPQGWAAEKVLETAKAHGVGFTPGALATHTPASLQTLLLLTMTTPALLQAPAGKGEVGGTI